MLSIVLISISVDVDAVSVEMNVDAVSVEMNVDAVSVEINITIHEPVPKVRASTVDEPWQGALRAGLCSSAPPSHCIRPDRATHCNRVSSPSQN